MNAENNKPTATPVTTSEATPAPVRPRTPRPQPSPLAVITAALGTFLIVLTLLAIQVRNGRDPALGPGPVVAPTSQPISAKGNTTKSAAATKLVTRTSPRVP